MIFAVQRSEQSCYIAEGDAALVDLTCEFAAETSGPCCAPLLCKGTALDFRLNLETETIAQVFSADPVCVAPETSLHEVFELLRAKNRGCVLVCRDGKLEGIFTERDALRLMAAGDNLERSVEEVMVSPPVTARVGEKVAGAIHKMSAGGYRRLPVVDEHNVPIGVLNVSGILHYFVEHFPNVIYNLPPEPHHAMQEREGA